MIITAQSEGGDKVTYTTNIVPVFTMDRHDHIQAYSEITEDEHLQLLLWHAHAFLRKNPSAKITIEAPQS